MHYTDWQLSTHHEEGKSRAVMSTPVAPFKARYCREPIKVRTSSSTEPADRRANLMTAVSQLTPHHDALNNTFLRRDGGDFR